MARRVSPAFKRRVYKRGKDFNQPRDTMGRFIDIPDKIKTKANVKAQSRTLNDMRKSLEVARERIKAKKSSSVDLDGSQQTRLRSVLSRKEKPGAIRTKDGKPLSTMITPKSDTPSIGEAFRTKDGRSISDVIAERRTALKPDTPAFNKTPLSSGLARPVLKADPDHSSNQPKVPSKSSRRGGGGRSSKVKTLDPLDYLTDETPTPRGDLPSWVKSAKDLPSTRKPPNHGTMTVRDDGQIRLWQNDNRRRTFDESFKVSKDKDFDYTVEHEGQQIKMNRNKTVYQFRGETVKGVPDSMTPNLETKSNASLFKALTHHTAQVEQGATSPVFLPGHNGDRIDQKYLYKGKYGKTEIHHVQQWAKEPLKDINDDYRSGKITLQQAQDRTRRIVRPTTTSSSGYELDIKPKEQRSFVLLGAGSHNFTSPLYEANHPLMIHPDSGILSKVGIPKQGDGGRKDYDKWRPKFWKEVSRRESFLIQNEINRRVRSGDLTKDEVERLWTSSRHRMKKTDINVRALKDDIKRIRGGSDKDDED